MAVKGRTFGDGRDLFEKIKACFKLEQIKGSTDATTTNWSNACLCIGRDVEARPLLLASGRCVLALISLSLALTTTAFWPVRLVIIPSFFRLAWCVINTKVIVVVHSTPRASLLFSSTFNCPIANLLGEIASSIGCRRSLCGATFRSGIDIGNCAMFLKPVMDR